MKIQRSKINAVLFSAFIIRIIALICIVLLAEVLPAYGLRGNFVDADDYRYEQGAVEYAHSADGIIDVETFTEIYDSMGDWTGHHLFSLQEFLSWSPLWYWIVCILLYITKWRWSIRILNILLVTFSIKYVYKLTQYVYGERTALLAARLMAYLPYLVIFSCFSYKDCLIMFCTFFLWYFFIKKKYADDPTRAEWFGCAFCILLLLLTRSGLSIVLVCMLLGFFFFDEIVAVVRSRRSSKKRITVILLAFVLAGVLAYLFWEPISRKISAYILNTSGYEDLQMGKLVKIRNIREIWKLPFTLALAIMQPIGFVENIGSWADIAGFVNIVMCPIAVGFLLYLIQRDKPDQICFWFMTAYYTVTAISSVLVFRHLFSVLPIPLIGFADFIARGSLEKKKLWAVLSIIATVLLAVLMSAL